MNLEHASCMAIETIQRFNQTPGNADPLQVLNELPNVILLPYEMSEDCDSYSFVGENQDAFSIVNKKDGNLHYIIIYNQHIASSQLRLALARELGHVILQHDGNSPECVWTEEANCFAYFFLCPLSVICQIKRLIGCERSEKIHFMPRLCSDLWNHKSVQSFSDIQHIKAFVVDEQNRRNRFIGMSNSYTSKDVELIYRQEYDPITGWKNCYDIILNGQKVGFCGK